MMFNDFHLFVVTFQRLIDIFWMMDLVWISKNHFSTEVNTNHFDQLVPEQKKHFLTGKKKT